MKRSITLTTILLVSIFLFMHEVIAQPTPTPTPVLPEGYDWKYNPDNGHYYAYVDQTMSWKGAYNFAQELGGYILTITDEQEQQWLISTFSSSYGGFIGLQYDGKWKWITGESYSYNNWAPGEPSGDGSIVEISGIGWNDRPDTHEKPFMVEIDQVPVLTPTPKITPNPTPTPEIWSSLNGETLEDNYLTAGAPAGYTQGRIKFGEIPEGEGSDGRGMEIKLAPGQGVFISSFKDFAMPSLVHLSGSFRADNKDVAIALVGLNSPVDGQIGYTNVRGEEVPVNDYRKFNLIFAPPSGNVQYAIQAVNSPFSTISSTVWVDNIEVKSYEPIVDFEPVALEVDGNFEGGLESLMVNINGDDGTVIPFFETITDIALRMSIEPSNIAANIGTTCQGIYDQFPFSLLGQVSVKRESMPGGGMMALVITNGFQNLGIFRFADQIKTINDVQDEMLIIGGDFNTNNPDIPISAFVQLGGPGADVSVVVDDIEIFKDGYPYTIVYPTQNPSSPSPTYINTPISISTPTQKQVPLFTPTSSSTPTQVLLFTPTSSPTPQLIPSPIPTPSPTQYIFDGPITINGFVKAQVPSGRVYNAQISFNEFIEITVDSKYSITLPKPGIYKIQLYVPNLPKMEIVEEFLESMEYNIIYNYGVIITPTPSNEDPINKTPTATITPTIIISPSPTATPLFPSQTEMHGDWLLKLGRGASGFTSDTYIVKLLSGNILVIDDPEIGVIQGTYSYNDKTGLFNGQYSKSGNLSNLGRYQLNGEFSGQMNVNQELVGVIKITQISFDLGISVSDDADFIGRKID